jgi:thiamine biosynthesis lipoprotein
VGFRKLKIDFDGRRLAKSHPEMEVDFNSIAPGYAADRIGELLEARGLSNYLVDIGGEVRGRGEKAAGQSWVVGIETPSEVFAQGVEARVELRNLSLATSGNYRNYFEKEGVRFSHILDPRTGRPVTHRLASVTVLHEKAALADAWATALLVLGPEQGMRVAENYAASGSASGKELAVFMLVATESGGFRSVMSSAFERHLAGRSKGVQ